LSELPGVREAALPHGVIEHESSRGRLGERLGETNCHVGIRTY